MLEELRREVCAANLLLPKLGLVNFTWGNVSGIDREKNLFVIKPSGVEYEKLTPENMVVVNLRGETVEGTLRPSSDTLTHMVLYNEFPSLGGIVHVHSPWATAFAQAGVDLEPLGTTHADAFYGAVPVTDALTEAEIQTAYEENTGKAIVRTFRERKIDPDAVPAVLARQHGPFAWAKSPAKAVEVAKTLELVAEMNYHTLQLTRADVRLPQFLLDKHYFRKHGANAYYGQQNRG